LIWLGILVVSTAQGLFAQTNATFYDFRRFNFGGQLGVNTGSMRTQYVDFPIQTITGQKVLAIRSDPNLGLNLGLVCNLRIHDNLDLRLIPAVSLQQRNFQFLYTDSVQTRKVEAVYLDIPLLVKYKSDVYRNYRVYVATGPRLGINLVSTERVLNDTKLLKTIGTDLGWVVSLGMDLYGDRVKLSPELSYSFGLRNIYVDANTDIPGVIKALLTQTLSLNFYLE
jgi:hypothetical protein